MRIRWVYVWVYDITKGIETCISYIADVLNQEILFPKNMFLSTKEKLCKLYCKEKVP